MCLLEDEDVAAVSDEELDQENGRVEEPVCLE